MRKPLIATALSFALLTGVIGAWAQNAPSPEASISGRVTDVFGNRFVIDAGTSRILVDSTGSAPLKVSPGDRVTAIGNLSEATLTARRVTAEDGTVLMERAATTPTTAATATTAAIGGVSSIDAALATLQLTAISPPVRKKREIEVLARTTDGRTVYVTFDRLGRIDEIESASHDKKRIVATRVLSRADYEDFARRSGFEPLDDFEQKKDHVELLARNKMGEFVELHMDRNGYIYKQEWVR